MSTATTAHNELAPKHEGKRELSTSPQRLISLARAEWLQFIRNKTLLFMATVFPIGIPLILFFIGDGTAIQAANSFDMFIFYTLLFVQFYTVLSMATTRRDERVLKRLRTGEARDVEILGAICAPGAVLAVIFAIVIVPLLMVLGAPAPVNLLLIAVALLLGLAMTSALALLTSSFTKNAEAAQITSLPVMTLALAGMGSLRPIFGDTVFAEIIGYTPFAAISDLIGTGWAGGTFTQLLAGTAPLDFAGTFGAAVQPLLILVVWTVVCIVAAKRLMRWDSHR
ncbi:ABC transporter permease [Corynebacterium sp. A21]|uniref:ABC transporter permease n=1 Tax=Corynebacterium sp. A21 TaxID=3457318 RepID=UPI003FD3DC3E